MKLIYTYIKRHLRVFLVAVFFLTIEAAADLLQPAFMAHIVDEGVVGQDIGVILRYGAIMLGIAVAGAFAAVMRNILAGRTSQQIGMELRGDIYRKVQTLAFENIDRLQTGAIITRITNDVTQILNFINSCMRIVVKMPITCIGAIVLIIMQTPQQLPIIAIILIIATFLVITNVTRGYPRYGALQRKLDLLNDVSREFLSSIRVVKAFNAEEQEARRFYGAADEFAHAGVAAARVQAVFGPLINLTVNFGIVVLLFLSQNQDVSQIGRLMASINYMTQVLMTLNMASDVLNTAARGVASADRVQEILDETPAQVFPVSCASCRIEATMTFDDVSFSYAGAAREVLHDVAFRVNPGETVGIIGPTGSGKTTLAHLVPRFYDATSGSVRIGGCDVTELDIETLRDTVSIAPQKAVLFTGTIEENLRWGNEHASIDQIRQAAKLACADRFVEHLEGGYDALIGQGGVNLSGGQQQRLSIARALLKHPKILILDDCTSALDATTEATVLSNLRTVLADTTVLLVSQRIATVMHTDRILCLDDGAVVGFGVHRELIDTCALYRAIYDSQIGGGIDG